jgi:outer membrane protein OmpA-like peptidoglycan-associated protein
VAVADGEVTWARPAAPAPLRVRFARGSAALTPAAAAPLAPRVAAAGGWRFTLQGSASAEGDLSANAALAAARCGAVARALVAAGLPAGALVEVAPAVAGAGLSAEDARACVLLPTPPVSP